MVSLRWVKTTAGKVQVFSIPADRKYGVVLVAIPLGRFNEPYAESAHALEHYVMLGTKNFPSRSKVLEALDRIGGSVYASTNDHFTSFLVKVPLDSIKLGVKIAIDLVFRPLLRPTDLSKVKSAIGVELSGRKTEPKYIIHGAETRALFSQHSYGYRPDVNQRLESLKQLTHAKLKQLYQSQYASTNVIIGCAGNVSASSWDSLIQSACKGVKNQRKELLLRESVIYEPKDTRERTSGESALVARCGMIPYEGARDVAIQAVTQVVFQSTSKNSLMKVFRERLQLSYNAAVAIHTLNQSMRIVSFRADCTIESLAKTRLALQKYIKSWNPRNISIGEFKDAKSRLVGLEMMRDSVSKMVVEAIFENRFYGCPLGADDRIHQLKSVKRADVIKCAKQMLQSLQASTIVGG